MTASEALPYVSAGVAIVAVVVGPVIQLLIARKQMATSLQVAKQQSETALLVATRQMETTLQAGTRQTQTALQVARVQAAAPIVQAWIKELRDLIAEFCQLGTQMKVTWDHAVRDREEVFRVGLLAHKVQLMLDVTDKGHVALGEACEKMVASITRGGDVALFVEARDQTLIIGRDVIHNAVHDLRKETPPPAV